MSAAVVEAFGSAFDAGVDAARVAINRRYDAVAAQIAEAQAAKAHPPDHVYFERSSLELAAAGLGELAQHRDAIVRLGDRQADYLLRLATGDDAAALGVARASGQTVADYLLVADSVSETTARVTAQREADHAAMVESAQRVGLAAIRFAIPFLLAAL